MDEDDLNRHFELLDTIVGDGADESDDPPMYANNLTFEPGTLSIFQGSQCLHRVTQCRGDRDRYVAVLCFSIRPGVKNSAKVQEMFWGRSLP